MWTLIFNCGLLLFFAYLGMKTVPAYMENSAVKKALDSSMGTFKLSSEVNKKAIIKDMEKRLYIDGIRGIDLKQAITVDKSKANAVVTIDYEKRVPLFYNINLALDFPYTVEK